MSEQAVDEELENELELIRAMYPDRNLSSSGEDEKKVYKIELEPNT